CATRSGPVKHAGRSHGLRGNAAQAAPAYPWLTRRREPSVARFPQFPAGTPPGAGWAEVFDRSSTHRRTFTAAIIMWQITRHDAQRIANDQP
ncbi:hypothetical protein ACYX7E_12220, partial [Luteimonas sp. RIT-PG2_3]